jgi:hypothetical protein
MAGLIRAITGRAAALSKRLPHPVRSRRKRKEVKKK